MLKGIEVLTHSSIRISKGKVIYIDPFNVDKEYNDADIILITHSHYDHYSDKDINKVKKEDTIFIVPEDVKEKLLNRNVLNDNIIAVHPERNNKVNILGLNIEVIPAYNINKKFHLKESGWVGYIITINNIRYYIAGDTDITEENKNIKCDVALVPVGGIYTMTYVEAAKLVNIIKPKIAIPIHYGNIVGTIEDASKFIKLLDKDIKGTILIK